MDIANNNILISKDKCRWQDLWIKKIDYYEYQINQFKKKYPYLYQTFSYYSGLTESAIMLANTVLGMLGTLHEWPSLIPSTALYGRHHPHFGAENS